MIGTGRQRASRQISAILCCSPWEGRGISNFSTPPCHSKDVWLHIYHLYNQASPEKSLLQGVVLELKWSLPLSDELLEKEIIELGKYVVPLSNWRKPADMVGVV